MDNEQFNESGFYPQKAREMLSRSGFNSDNHHRGTIHRHPDMPGHIIIHDKGWQHHTTTQLAHLGNKHFPSVMSNNSITGLKNHLSSGMAHAADLDKFVKSDQAKAYGIKRIPLGGSQHSEQPTYTDHLKAGGLPHEYRG